MREAGKRVLRRVETGKYLSRMTRQIVGGESGGETIMLPGTGVNFPGGVTLIVSGGVTLIVAPPRAPCIRQTLQPLTACALQRCPLRLIWRCSGAR